MGDMGDDFRAWRDDRRKYRNANGVPCPKCKEVRQKAHASILLPGQKCRVDGYVDPRHNRGVQK
jgi:hypothetical protein